MSSLRRARRVTRGFSAVAGALVVAFAITTSAAPAMGAAIPTPDATAAPSASTTPSAEPTAQPGAAPSPAAGAAPVEADPSPAPTTSSPGVAPATAAPTSPVITSPRMRAAAAAIGILAAGVPEPPTQVWTEGFDAAGNALITLPSYQSGAYTADPFWLDFAKCNGVLVTYNTSTFGGTECTSSTTQNQTNARINVRRLADVLGQVNAGVVGSQSSTAPVNGSTTLTQANRAVAEWTDSGSGTAGQTRVVDKVASIGISPTTSRYYTSSIDIVEASCETTTSRSSITLSLVAGSTTSTGSAITACTDSRASYYTSPLIAGQTGWINGGASVRAGRFTSDTSVLLTAAQAATLRPVVRNSNLASGGNDFAVDNLRIVDATPSLDKSFAADTVVAGTPTTLTFTVTNTSELASKTDWSFTDALPSGLVVAPTPAVGGTCANVTGAAFSVQAAAGAAAIAVTGGDLAAGAVSCTVTVNVVSNTPGTYVNGAANVTTVLNAPESATLVVEAPARITIQKNVTGRSTATDQFRLALSSGATELATATTTGSATGVQTQQVGPINVSRGATYNISESILTTAPLNTYVTSYQCLRGTTTIATGTSISGPITIPDEPGAEIVCTFTNTPQAASLYCDGTYYYAVRSNGSLAQVNAVSTAAPTQITGAVTGAVDVNALGVNGDGSGAIAVDRGSTPTSAAAIVTYAITPAGGIQSTRTTLTAAQGAFVDRTGVALDGTIIAGAVDPLNGRFIVGKSATGSVRLWEYTPNSLNNGSRFLYLGQVNTGTTTGENGDISFDAQGNLHIVQTAADSSNVGMFSVTRETLLAATGSTTTPLAASATVRRALSGTDTGFALTAVNGMAFSPTGTVYLGNATTAYQFDPTTWVRVPNSPRATIGTTATGAGSTDLAACASPSTISLEKNIVGRVAAVDQFRLALSAGTPLTESSTATTSGATTGVQPARIGPTPVQINTSVTISETMATGSTSPLTAYTSVYECWADGVRIATGTEKSVALTIPNRLSVGVACTFTNSPAPFATVRVTKIVENASGTGRTPTPGWTMTATATANTGSTVTLLPNRNPSQVTGADGTATWQMLFGSSAQRGRVTIAETSQSGYRYQSLVCTVNGTTGATTVTTVGDQVRGTLNVDIGPGNTVDCVFSNRPVATLTLVKNVSFGSAATSSWQLAATRSIATALAGPAGAGGSAALTGVQVSADTAYRLSESGGPATYVQVGNWSCVTATGTSVPVTAAGDVTLTRGTAVTCTVTNATASLTLLKNVVNPSAGFQPSTWNLTATPATLAGLAPVTVAGADYTTTGNGNQASTFAVRPGHTYTLSEALAQSGTRLAYQQVRLELRQPNGTWVAVSTADTPTITAPAAGQTAIYRFVNAPVNPTTLPLTGGASTDAFLLAGSAVLVLALALAVWHGRRRARRSVV
jgi:LPXTG-motif cell wall-anchored protein